MTTQTDHPPTLPEDVTLIARVHLPGGYQDRGGFRSLTGVLRGMDRLGVHEARVFWQVRGGNGASLVGLVNRSGIWMDRPRTSTAVSHRELLEAGR